MLKTVRENVQRIQTDEYWVGVQMRREPGWLMRAHCHAQLELGLITKGACRIVVGGTVERYRAGQAYFLPGESVHTFEADPAMGLWITVVHFPFLRSDLVIQLLNLSANSPLLTSDEQDRFVSICAEIQSELVTAHPFTDIQCQALVNQLAVLVLRRAARIEAETIFSQQVSQLAAAVQWIHEHASADIRIQDIADQVHVSPSHLRRLFQAKLGVSPQNYVHNVRIQTAKSLLMNTDDSIDVVARRSGFAAAPHFSRMFKRATGQSPTQWRKANLSFVEG